MKGLRELRLAIAGKGGSGKSVVAGTVARVLARRGNTVLALDSDLMPGLASSLGTQSSPRGSLEAAVDRNAQGRWRLRKGIGPARAVQRYSTVAADGVRLLEAGKLTAEGLDPIMGSVNGYYQLIHRLRRSPSFAGWALVGDLPAGPRQVAFDWAPYADVFVVLVEPTWKSALTARRIARIARARRGARAHLIVNRASGPAEERRVAELAGEPPLAAIPLDDAVVRAERRGVALIDDAPSSPAARAVERLVDRLVSE